MYEFSPNNLPKPNDHRNYVNSSFQNAQQDLLLSQDENAWPCLEETLPFQHPANVQPTEFWDFFQDTEYFLVKFVEKITRGKCSHKVLKLLQILLD